MKSLISIFSLFVLNTIFTSVLQSQTCSYSVSLGNTISYNSTLGEYSWSDVHSFNSLIIIVFYSDRFDIKSSKGVVTYINLKSVGKDGKWNMYEGFPIDGDHKVVIAIDKCTYTDLNNCNCFVSYVFAASVNIWYFDLSGNPQGGYHFNLQHFK